MGTAPRKFDTTTLFGTTQGTGTAPRKFDTTTLFGTTQGTGTAPRKFDTTTLFGTTHTTTATTPKPGSKASGVRLQGERAIVQLGSDISLSREGKGLLSF